MKEVKSNYCEHCGEFHDQPHDFVSQVRVGESVPDFEFEAFHEGKVKTLSLSSLRGRWLVLAFYPADFSLVSLTELAELAELRPKFKKAGAEIVSVSCDSVYAHQAWHDSSKGVGSVGFPMAADPSGKLSYAFGVLVEGGDAHFTPDEGLALRGTFIIDPAGYLRAAEIVDSSMGRKAAETLRKLQMAEYVETHPGQACPASWEPGDDALTTGPDPVGKR